MMGSRYACWLMFIAGGFAILWQQVLAADQNSFSIEVERSSVSMPKVNRSIVFQKFSVTKYNRTFVLMNMTFQVVRDLPPEVDLHLAAFEKLDGGKKLSTTPLRYPVGNLCAKMANKDGWESVTARSNFPSKCPWKAGKYSLRKYPVDMSSLPPYLAADRWRLEIAVKQRVDVLATFSVDIFINRRHLQRQRKGRDVANRRS